MIGVVIVAHGGLAGEFRAALEHVVGPQEHLEPFSIGPEDDVEARRMELIEAVRRVDAGKGVVVLTDMFGGTPSNLAISVMEETGAEVLAGINLPMLIKLASVRGEATLAGCDGGGQGGRAEVHQHCQSGAVGRGMIGATSARWRARQAVRRGSRSATARACMRARRPSSSSAPRASRRPCA